VDAVGWWRVVCIFREVWCVKNAMYEKGRVRKYHGTVACADSFRLRHERGYFLARSCAHGITLCSCTFGDLDCEVFPECCDSGL